jgi:hypothetical protein
MLWTWTSGVRGKQQLALCAQTTAFNCAKCTFTSRALQQTVESWMSLGGIARCMHIMVPKFPFGHKMMVSESKIAQSATIERAVSIFA